MCGIYGAVSWRAPIDATAAMHSRDTLAHRGPDDSGFWLSADQRVALGHRRLAVVDLTPGGHQPMQSADQRLTIVFNGEIYNFQALRAQLVSLGHRFGTRSDTEVLIAAWREWGAECLPRMNGMFAFAVHDRGDGTTAPRLFLARDRAGKKPLYYRLNPAGFEFASELKALAGPHRIDLPALNRYLALGYVPGEHCIAAGVRKLPPAHHATLDLATGALTISRWWQLPVHQPDLAMTMDDAATRTLEILEDSVRLRLTSDVPVGILLSGGLDSSLITAIAAGASSGRVRTFTFAQPGSPLDEAAGAARIARAFDTEHHTLEVANPSLATLTEFMPMIDEPLADSSLIPAWLVCRLARTQVTVALGGDGGDELFGGYAQYGQALADAARTRFIPDLLLRVAAQAAGALPAGVRGRNRLSALGEGAARTVIWGSPYFDLALRRRVLVPGAIGALDSAPGGLDAPERELSMLFDAGHGVIDSMTRTHFGSILPDDFMVKVDRASMAHALEMRSPQLDWRLIEFAFRDVPDRLKVGAAGSRLIQRELARRLLPADVDFSRKQGFSIPIDDWLRADGDAMFEQWETHLPEAIARDEVARLRAGLHAGRANGARLYSLLVLAMANHNLTSATSWH